MFGDSVIISRCDKISRFSVLDLEGDSASAACNNRLSVVNSLGNLDFEAFTSRKLQNNLCVGEKSVED